MSTLDMKVGDRIHTYRERLHMSVEDLAETRRERPGDCGD